jgi:tetratricopeptide (TPR) repeat protein
LNREDTLRLAADLVDNDEPDKGYRLAEPVLNSNPDDPQALNIIASALMKKGNASVAYHLTRKLVELEPKNPWWWLTHGMASEELFKFKEAAQAYAKGMNLTQDSRCRVLMLNNICAMLVQMGKFEEAEYYSKKALEIAPEMHKAKGNMGFCQLARRQWGEGWKNYHHALGQVWRPMKQYADEPEWDGTPGRNVVIYGEQGIGDEICFASMLPDAIKASAKVIIDCNPKLERLFERSFPKAIVQSGFAGEDDFDSSLAIGQLGEHFRTSNESFKAEPFLVADPDRVSMWRHLWSQKRKPVIGIAWTGGIPRTGAKFRAATLEDWLPMFQAIDAHWVSLQYKSAESEIAEFKARNPWVDLVEYPHATLTQDYDDTAALVASLDCIVSVPTAVLHLAGALGVPNVMMKASVGCWKTAAGIPFHPVTQFVEWQGAWLDSIKASIPHVEVLCSASSSVTTPDNPLPLMLQGQALNGTHLSQ